MKELSRTLNSLRNARVALFFSVILLGLNFFSRKVFIDCLSVDVLGLNTTATNLFGFLNLAELGISSAIAYTLYVPLYQRNYKEINEIVTVHGWLYRRIAYFVLIGGTILMCLFPWFFAKINLPLWYAYGSFGVLLVAAMLGYIINYKQIILSADQQEYKITYNVQGFRCVKIFVQIIGVKFFFRGYVFWLIIELLFSVITCFFLNKTIQKSYPWLLTNLSQGKILSKKYPQIKEKVKQIFFHRVSFYVLGQTSPLIIYLFLSLSDVAIYGNYILIIHGLLMLVNSIFNGIIPGVGNLVAEGDIVKIMSFFKQYTTLRFWLASIICCGLYYLTTPFMILWVGREYLLEYNVFILIIFYAFISMTRTNDTFLAAYGLFQDIWAPITEACINLFLSLLLGYYWGLTGIITGVLISLLVIVCGWKPYFLYHSGFKSPMFSYVFLICKLIILIALSYFIASISFSLFQETVNSWFDLFLHAIKLVGLYTMISFFVFGIFSKDFRVVIHRFIAIM